MVSPGNAEAREKIMGGCPFVVKEEFNWVYSYNFMYKLLRVNMELYMILLGVIMLQKTKLIKIHNLMVF